MLYLRLGCSVTQSCLKFFCDPPLTAACQAFLFFAFSQSFLKLIHWVSDAIQTSHSLSPSFHLPLIFPSIKVFFNESVVHIKCQSIGAAASVLPKSIQGWFPLKFTGLTSLLSKELKNLLQHHSLKASILQCSDFFTVQFSYPYMTNGKTIPWPFGLSWQNYIFVF